MSQIYLRSVETGEVRALPGTRNALAPFFSPDGQWLGFGNVSGMAKVSVGGGAVLPLTTFGGNGAFWGADGVITTATPTGLQRMPETGGTLSPLTHLEQGDGTHRLPNVLPGGRGVLFAVATSQTAAHVVYVSMSGQRRDLIPAGTAPRYAPTGHLVYAQAGTLFGVPFDLDTQTVKGNPVPLVQGVLQTTAGFPHTASRHGHARVRVGRGDGAALAGMGGARRHGAGAAGRAARIRLAAPVARRETHRRGSRRADLGLRHRTRYADAPDLHGLQNDGPAWTPDGTHIVNRSNREGTPASLFWQMADGSGGSERLSTADQVADLPLSFSPDGQFLAFIRTDPKTLRDIWLLSLKDRTRKLFLSTPTTEGAPRFSPDGRWIAYVSDESGRPEIYVQPFPGPGGKWQISTDGGIEPAWNPNGRELFYRIGDRMMAVPITTTPAFCTGRPTMLFERPYMSSTFPLTGVTVRRHARRAAVPHGEGSIRVGDPDQRRRQLVRRAETPRPDEVRRPARHHGAAAPAGWPVNSLLVTYPSSFVSC